jgi:hypothetical protein
VLRDTGIDSNCWALLQNVIIHFANQDGVRVTEDSPSADVYQEPSEVSE